MLFIFNAIPFKILANYFVVINKLILKCIWKGKRPNQHTTEEKQSQNTDTKKFKMYYDTTWY